MSDLWYVYKQEGEYGPYSLEDLALFLRDGFLEADDQVRAEGEQTYQDASTLPALFATASPGGEKAPPVAGGTGKRRPSWKIIIPAAFLGFCLITFLAVATLWAVNRNDTEQSEPIPRSATITASVGAVTVQRAEENVLIPARAGMTLEAGDRLNTGETSLLELTYDDGSITRLGENSRARVDLLHGEEETGADITLLDAEKGAFWHNVVDLTRRNSRFHVNTPAAVAGVRGTLFFTSISSDGTVSFRVYGGQIGIIPDGTTEELLVDYFREAVYPPGAPYPERTSLLTLAEVSDFEIINLMGDDLHGFLTLIVHAAEREEWHFLERIRLLLYGEDARRLLGRNRDFIQTFLEQLLREDGASLWHWDPWREAQGLRREEPAEEPETVDPDPPPPAGPDETPPPPGEGDPPPPPRLTPDPSPWPWPTREEEEEPDPLPPPVIIEPEPSAPEPPPAEDPGTEAPPPGEDEDGGFMHIF